MSTSSPVISAILWDVPSLRASGNSGFTQVFRSSRTPASSDFESSDLFTAACGMHELLFGDERKGRELVESLTGSADHHIALLRTAALAWPLSVPSEDSLSAFLHEISESKLGDETESRLLLKALTFCIDGQMPSFAEELCGQLRERVPKMTPLHRVVEYVCQKVLGESLPTSVKTSGKSDPLVDLDWIDWHSLESARETLDKTVDRLARSAWTETVQIGGGSPLEEGIAAELASTWAGAIWLRRPIQKQLAQEVLVRDLVGNATWAKYAATRWVAAGERFTKISDIVEPHLPAGAADEILESVPLVVRANALTGYVEFDALADLWDLISESRCETFLQDWTPPVGAHPNLDNLRAAWTLMALRIPDRWAERYWTLSTESQLSILGSVTGWTAQNLPDEPAKALLSVALEQTPEHLRSLGGDWWDSVAGLCVTTGTPMPDELLDSLNPSETVRLAENYGQFVSRARLLDATSALQLQAASDIDEARSGTVHGYTVDPRSLIGRAMVISEEVEPTALQLLLDTVSREDTPLDYRHGALSALWRLTLRGCLEESIVDVVRDAPLGGLSAFLFEPRTSRMLAYITPIVAWFEGTDQHRAELLSLSRDDDPSARAVVVDCAGLLAVRHDDAAIGMIPVSALFDPSRDVVRAAVRAIPTLPRVTVDGMQTLISERFAAILNSRDRRLRTEVVTASNRLVELGFPGFVRFVDAGKTDASWFVRREAEGN